MMTEKVKPGVYQHFKGDYYIVIACAKHSESLEDLVIYKHIDKDKIWARPISMFFEIVELHGKSCSRFRPVDASVSSEYIA